MSKELRAQMAELSRKEIEFQKKRMAAANNMFNKHDAGRLALEELDYIVLTQ